MAKSKKLNRCAWAESGNELYIAYHDTEWGVPGHDDRKQFEFLVLEGAQAGLSAEPKITSHFPESQWAFSV